MGALPGWGPVEGRPFLRFNEGGSSREGWQAVGASKLQQPAAGRARRALSAWRRRRAGSRWSRLRGAGVPLAPGSEQ